jgi:hypothetical protein
MELKKIFILIVVMSCLTLVLSLYLLNSNTDLKKPGFDGYKNGIANHTVAPANGSKGVSAGDENRNDSGMSSEPTLQENISEITEAQSPTNSSSVEKKMEGSPISSGSQAKKVEKILRQLGEDQDREKAFTGLVEIKDELKGEALHTAMKEMYQFGDMGGNDVLIDTFLNLTSDVSPHDKMRILSYINPESKIKEKQLSSLAEAYGKNSKDESSGVILMTISRAGGDFGAKLIIDMINPQKKDETYVQEIRALGLSDSAVAKGYLHETLNELVRVKKDEQNTELVNMIRNLIQQKNPQ